MSCPLAPRTGSNDTRITNRMLLRLVGAVLELFFHLIVVLRSSPH
jgi:hypothetical protein